MALFYIVNPKRKKAIRPAKTQRDPDIQHKAVHLKRTSAQIKQEYPKLSLSSIYRILRRTANPWAAGRVRGGSVQTSCGIGGRNVRYASNGRRTAERT